MEKRPDVIELLEKEKEYHLLQIKRINLAISALKSEEPSGNNINKQKTVPWTKLIKDIIAQEEGAVSIDRIQDKIISFGYNEANKQSGKNAINTTLSRLVNVYDYLEKTEDGKYRRKHGGKEAKVEMFPT